MKQELESPIAESTNKTVPWSKPVPKHFTVVGNTIHRIRRAVLDVPCPELRKADVPKSIVRPVNTENSKVVEGKKDVNSHELLQKRPDTSENLIKKLQSEVSALKAQLEKALGSNVELERLNRQLTHQISAAQSKISDLEKLNKPPPNPTHVSWSFPPPPSPPPPPSAYVSMDRQQPPPPPPLPPSIVAPARENTVKKASALVELYHSLNKKDGKMSPMGNANSDAHSSIVGEIQNRSAHLLAIKADIETKGDFIRSLIQKVNSAAYTEIEDILTFVDWLDGELSTLADERAVLKHFEWPEKKADAIREAAFEYRDIKHLEHEISSFEDDPSVSCEALLKKIVALLDKSERSIQRLIKLRDATFVSYKESKIPTDWMLDNGMIKKIKMASVKLAKVYIKRVTMEINLVRHSERDSMQEALLIQSVRFAYRAHQFAGGLDSETLYAFEELGKRFQLHVRGSRELLSSMYPS